MKRWIAILMVACLLAGIGAMAQDDGSTAEPAFNGSKLPAPEEVAELESEADEPAEAEDAAEDEAEATPEPGNEDEGEVAEEDVETEAPEETEIPEAEPTEQPAEAAENIEVWFEEGFGLTLPAGWVSYAVSDEDKANGVRYALGDGTGEHILYIQINPTLIQDVQALSQAVENTEGLSKTGELSFGGADFVAFIDALQNASCCATLLNGEQVVFMFTPQTDSDFMLVASKLMESFTIL